jgi:hypothetical protein
MAQRTWPRDAAKERFWREAVGGHDNGGKAAAVLYSIMASAKSNQVEPFAYVRDVLKQMSGCSPPAVEAPLPDAWLAVHKP